MIPVTGRPIEEDGRELEPGVKYLVDDVVKTPGDETVTIVMPSDSNWEERMWNFYHPDPAYRIRICTPHKPKTIIIINK